MGVPGGICHRPKVQDFISQSLCPGGRDLPASEPCVLWLLLLCPPQVPSTG